MNPFKPITNPMLCGTIELMKAENTPEHIKMFTDEMVRARYLAPVIVTPTPVPDANGIIKLTDEHKMQCPLLTAKDGTHVFAAFTDIEELRKWNPDPKQQTIGFTFNDYAELLFRKDKDGNTAPAIGFVINPMGNSIVVTKKMVAKVIASQMAQKGMPLPPMFMEGAPTEDTSSEEATDN